VCKVTSLVNTFPQAFLEFLHHSLLHAGRNCCHFFPDVLFQVHRCPWFLFVHLALERKKYCDSGHSVRWILKCRRNINDRIVVFEIRLHSKSPMLYRPALHGNWNALSLARRALKDKFPTPTVPLTAVLPNRQVFLPDSVYMDITLVFLEIVCVFWYISMCKVILQWLLETDRTIELFWFNP